MFLGLWMNINSCSREIYLLQSVLVHFTPLELKREKKKRSKDALMFPHRMRKKKKTSPNSVLVELREGKTSYKRSNGRKRLSVILPCGLESKIPTANESWSDRHAREVRCVQLSLLWLYLCLAIKKPQHEVELPACVAVLHHLRAAGRWQYAPGQ